MKKQWAVAPLETKDLANLPEYPKLLVRLLALRGITDPDKIQDFLNPDYGNLHDPYLFKDMQKAVERIQQAIEGKQKIAIYADYDADAITACSVLYLALAKLGLTPSYYIPDRFTEGYGMNVEAIKKLHEQGMNLIITVDCGINAVAEAEACKQLGIDLIITDHHELTGSLPEALAIINPKNPEEQYPFTYLTGVGVAYKLVQALFSKSQTGWEKWLLDLVAIGTVADCQSLTGENRILVSFGLKVLQKTRWPGLRAMLAASGVKGNQFDSFTLGFILAPRINAAGRLKHADMALRVLIAENQAEAEKYAFELNEVNKHRQVLTDQILSEARSQVELALDKKVLMTFGIDWPKGVVGLVAGRLTEEFNRPVLAISTTDGVATGSARSTAGFDIIDALGFAKEHLQRYGGHTQAAGFTLAHEKLEILHQKLLEYAEFQNFMIADPVLQIDAEIDPADLTWENLEYIERLAPFGVGNHKPKLLGRGFEVLEVRGVGDNKHLKMKLGFGGHRVEAIAFGQGFLQSQLTPGKKIDAVFELGANEWNGHKDMQLKVSDIKIND